MEDPNAYAAQSYDDTEEDEDPQLKSKNILPSWGNVNTMNLNPLILTNIQNSPYFKVNLFGLKTYHEVIDEIYYKVAHLEPWERGSRKTSGQTGMCGGVRGVGAGGIVSSAFCLLYKLFTLKLTRKQLNGIINHCDSPYIRGIGFMYIRFTQPPADLWDWMSPYFEDDEEIDVKAGGGKTITIGEMVRSFLTKLEWFDTRFPRIPVNTQKQISQQLAEWYPSGYNAAPIDEPPVVAPPVMQHQPSPSGANREPDRHHRRHRSRSRDRRSRSREWSRKDDGRRRDRSSRDRSSRDRSSRDRSSKDRFSRDASRERSSRDGEKSRDRHKHHKRSRSRDRDSRSKDYKRRDRSPRDFSDELRSYSEHRKNKKSKKHKRSRSRSRSRERKHRSRD